METATQLWRFRMVSVVIVVVLGLQLFAILIRTPKGWPFIDYSMYAASHEKGDRIPVGSTLYATSDDGAEVALTPEDVGLKNSWWVYRFWVLSALQKQPKSVPDNSGRAVSADADQPPSWAVGDRKSPERAMAFVLTRYDQLHHKKIVKLRLEDYGVIVTRHGMERVPPQVLWTWSAPADDGVNK